MRNDFHDAPFSESTRVKLALFERYFIKWLPTFLHRKPRPSKINIVDFFSGPGEDIEHTPGSPQLILRQMRIFKDQMGLWKGKLNVVFNDADRKKAHKLEELLAQKFSDVLSYVNVAIRNQEFADLYEELRPQLAQTGAANLLFVDQSGLRELPVNTFLSIVALDMTDLLFFVSSSTLVRFHELPEVRAYLPIPEDMIHGTEYYRIHKAVKRYYESQIPQEKEYYMGDFSLKKDANIYGVVFGSNHLLGLQKFVSTCWELDGKTGQANYDIDRESIDDSIPYLIPPVPRKVSFFQRVLASLVKNGQLRTNRDILEYYLTNGMLCRHAKPVLTKLKAERLIEKAVPISYPVAGKREPQAIVLKKKE